MSSDSASSTLYPLPWLRSRQLDFPGRARQGGNRLSTAPQIDQVRLEVQLDSVTNQSKSLFFGFSNRHAAREVRHVGSVGFAGFAPGYRVPPSALGWSVAPQLLKEE